jgi:hypothetical protein
MHFLSLSFLGASFPGIRPFSCVQALKPFTVGFTRFELLTSNRKCDHNSSVKTTATILPSCDVRNIGCMRKKKANRGPRLTPEGRRPRHPRRGGRRVGNAGQHGKRAATREGASNCAPDQQQTCVHQQALPHQQQTPQPEGHNRQEPSTQQQKQGGDKRTRSRKDPGATACKSGGHPQG